MGLTETEIKTLRNELDTSHRPLIFFDDDPDGLASFLLFYRYVGEGKGVCVKARPVLDKFFVRKVKEYSPDKVFVLDKPGISDEFIQQVSQKIVWLDHHEPNKKPQTLYFNPMVHKKGDNRPTAHWAYKVVEQDLWIAMIGVVGDWHLTDLAPKFSEQYPELLPSEVKTPEQALYDTELGKLVRMYSFILKGRTSQVNKYVRVLTRIKDPYEILEKTTPQGKYIYKNFKKINKKYEEMLNNALEHGNETEKMLVYHYADKKMSFTGDLANELLYRSKKVVVVCRQKNGEMKCSLRSPDKNILKPIKRALENVDGYGGGHEQACGACINVEDWDKFLKEFSSNIS